MIERGIHTTKADLWIHLHPLDYRAYWYLVRHLLEQIERRKLIPHDGRSKDGTVTGRGYLIGKLWPFISSAPIPARIIDVFDWDRGTDRELGIYWGETAIDWALSDGLLPIHQFAVEKMRSLDEQISDGDLIVLYRPLKIEVKTEMYPSKNLFVQTHEQGHKTNLAKNETGEVARRDIELPYLTGSGGCRTGGHT